MSPNKPELLNLPLHRPGPHLKPLSSNFSVDTQKPSGDGMLVDFCALFDSSQKTWVSGPLGHAGPLAEFSETPQPSASQKASTESCTAKPLACLSAVLAGQEFR